MLNLLIRKSFTLQKELDALWNHERLEQEKLEQERLEQERLERERLQREGVGQDEQERARLERERLEKERLQRERLRQEEAEQARLERERLRREEARPETPVTETPEQPAQPAQTSCAKRAGAEACTSYGGGVRGAVYTYYCLLTNNDFDAAYRVWRTTRSLSWFHKASNSFCNVNDFRIRRFNMSSETSDRAEAAYIVDLIDWSGSVIESWQMSTVLVKSGSKWYISAVNGTLTNQ